MTRDAQKLLEKYVKPGNVLWIKGKGKLEEFYPAIQVRDAMKEIQEKFGMKTELNGKDRSHLRMLQRRRDFLQKRLLESPKAKDYDKRERAAISWIIKLFEKYFKFS